MIVLRTVIYDDGTEAESELVDVAGGSNAEYAAVCVLMQACGAETVTIERGSLLRIRYERS